MPPSADVTVVVPTRNRAALIEAALASVQGQVPHPPASVVVVDDGSTDGTADRLAQCAPQATVLRNDTSQGVSAARNRGLESVETTWVCFLDDDDLWAPFHLAGLLEAAGADRQADLVCSGYVTTDAQRRPIRAVAPPAADEFRGLAFGLNPIATPSCVMLRTGAAKRLRGFDETLAVLADWDMWLRVATTGSVAVAPQISVGYMVHDGSMQRAPERILEELPALRARHAAAARRLGVALPGPGFSRYVAGSFRAADRRRSAAAWFLRSAVECRSARDVMRAAAALAPGLADLRRGTGRLTDDALGWLGDPRSEARA